MFDWSYVASLSLMQLWMIKTDIIWGQLMQNPEKSVGRIHILYLIDILNTVYR